MKKILIAASGNNIELRKFVIAASGNTTLYSYNGPIFQFGRYIGNTKKTYTTRAKSIQSAANNIVYHIKDDSGLSKDSKITIDMNLIKVGSGSSNDKKDAQSTLELFIDLNGVIGDIGSTWQYEDVQDFYKLNVDADTWDFDEWLNTNFSRYGSTVEASTSIDQCNDIARQVEAVLDAQHIWYESVEVNPADDNFVEVIVDVDGDWKHDHISCNIVMGRNFDVADQYSENHPNGDEYESDNYAAYHHYTIRINEEKQNE